MRTTAAALVVGLTLLVAPSAHAQFANRSLGIGLGYMKLNAGDLTPIPWGLPLTLEATYYVENGFDLYLHVPLMLLYQGAGVTPDGGGGLVVATGGQFGFRYLFMEETLRPWAGAHLAGIYIFPAAQTPGAVMGGVGVSGGVDYFVSDSISVGARLYVDLFLQLNQPVWFSVGGGLSAATYF